MLGSRDPGKEEIAAWLSAEGKGIATGTFADTASHGELVVLAVLGTAIDDVIGQAAPESLAGKVIIDTTNLLDFSTGFPPRLVWAHTDSRSERGLARRCRRARCQGIQHHRQPKLRRAALR